MLSRSDFKRWVDRYDALRADQIIIKQDYKGLNKAQKGEHSSVWVIGEGVELR